MNKKTTNAATKAATTPTNSSSKETTAVMLLTNELIPLKEAILEAIISHSNVQEAINNNKDLQLLESLYYEISFRANNSIN